VDEVGDLKAVHFINGQAEDAQQECRRLGEIINEHRVDVGLIGIGENGHLAFNDPPADFKTQEAYLIVELDEACRTQQVNEGWFETLDQVPRRAISMSIHQIMKCQTLIVSVPDPRKAAAVQKCEEGEISPMCPTSILQRHTHCKLFLDTESASLLKNDTD
ncbi:MAG: 6-phosphogluconolactonase, partial [Planctomycetes bacterium]|nr:6-phosphogluconolactonase [Planctomycetota bacterium]